MLVLWDACNSFYKGAWDSPLIDDDRFEWVKKGVPTTLCPRGGNLPKAGVHDVAQWRVLGMPGGTQV